jgi:hypothetical protein
VGKYMMRARVSTVVSIILGNTNCLVPRKSNRERRFIHLTEILEAVTPLLGSFCAIFVLLF